VSAFKLGVDAATQSWSLQRVPHLPLLARVGPQSSAQIDTRLWLTYSATLRHRNHSSCILFEYAIYRPSVSSCQNIVVNNFLGQFH